MHNRLFDQSSSIGCALHVARFLVLPFFVWHSRWFFGSGIAAAVLWSTLASERCCGTFGIHTTLLCCTYLAMFCTGLCLAQLRVFAHLLSLPQLCCHLMTEPTLSRSHKCRGCVDCVSTIRPNACTYIPRLCAAGYAVYSAAHLLSIESFSHACVFQLRSTGCRVVCRKLQRLCGISRTHASCPVSALHPLPLHVVLRMQTAG